VAKCVFGSTGSVIAGASDRVVAVLMINCQVSENPKIGPETAQTRMITKAAVAAAAWPVMRAAALANASNRPTFRS